MASIPLIALAGRPPEPVDTLGQYGRMVALKQAQQQMQYQQQMQPLQLQQEQQQLAIQHQQLVDQQAFHEAYSAWDGKDYDTLAGAVGKSGGSFQAVNSIRMAGLNQQKELSEILKNQGEAGKAHVQTLIDNNTIANQKISSLTGDDPQAVAAMAQEGLNAGWLDQQHAQALMKISQLPSDQMKATLPQFAKPFLSTATQADNAIKGLQAQQLQIKLPGERATAQEAVLRQQAIDSYLQQNPGKTIADYEVAQKGKQASAEAWARVGAEKNLEQYKINIQRGLLPPALQSVAPQLVSAAASNYEKASTDYLGTKQAADDMQTMIDLARSGNVLSYAYLPTTGVLTINTAHGVKRVNMAEIGSYGTAGSAFDRALGWFGKQATGASLDADVLNDMEQAHESLRQNADRKYSNQVDNINRTYGSKLQAHVLPAMPTKTAPAGATHKAPVTGTNEWHWLDANGNDLGLAQQ